MHTVLGERVERREPPAAGDDSEALVAIVVRSVGAGNEVLQQAVGPDGGGELGLGDLVRKDEP